MNLVEKPEGRRLLKSPSLGMEDNINMDLKELNGRAWAA